MIADDHRQQFLTYYRDGRLLMAAMHFLAKVLMHLLRLAAWVLVIWTICGLVYAASANCLKDPSNSCSFINGALAEAVHSWLLKK